MKYSLVQFNKRFPDNDTCLEAIKQLRFPHGIECEICDKVTNHYKVTGRTSYACASCGSHVYPLANTIFEHSSTPLTLWFFAMYLMSQTRTGISAKQLERMLGVTYKTAWRMFRQIRMIMKENLDPFTGIVEVDESYFGGKGVNRAYEWRADKKKEVIMGMVQRNGKAYMKHIDSANKETLVKLIKENIDSKAHIMTDEHPAYKNLYQEGYFNHHTVNHAAKEYVRKQLFHTNSVEGLWGRIKPAIKGVYRKVSGKYIESYMDEYCFRYNNRKTPDQMFDLLLAQVA